MPKFVPQDAAQGDWSQLEGKRAFAVRSAKGDVIPLRFGQGHGVYLTITDGPSESRLVNTVDFESGEPTLVGKISEKVLVSLGRTSDCALKIMHALVSRQHLQLRYESNVLMIRDLGSTNGTFLHKDTTSFDIDKYLADHPLDEKHEGTLDEIHQEFGPTLDDFLASYSKQKESEQ